MNLFILFIFEFIYLFFYFRINIKIYSNFFSRKLILKKIYFVIEKLDSFEKQIFHIAEEYKKKFFFLIYSLLRDLL